jgi:predicted nucleotidyltransferase
VTEETPEGRPLRGSEHEAFEAVLKEALVALEESAVDYLLIGGILQASYGRARRTHDIDFLVRPEDALIVLEALAKRGFRTEQTDRTWLYKGFLNDVMVDVIFHSAGGLQLGEEMMHRARRVRLGGRMALVIAPEDLIVINVAATAEVVPGHWYDALAILSETEIDWDYLVHRARHHAARRVLSLLLFAESTDIAVPRRALSALAAEVIG